MRAQRRGRDAGDLGRALGRPRLRQALDLLDAGHEARDARAVDAAGREQLVEEREEEEDVRAGADEDVLAGDLRGLGAARVDDEDVAAARARSP